MMLGAALSAAPLLRVGLLELLPQRPLLVLLLLLLLPRRPLLLLLRWLAAHLQLPSLRLGLLQSVLKECVEKHYEKV